MDEPQYNAKRAVPTRWPSRMTVVHNIFDTLPSQLASMDKLAAKDSDASAIGLKLLMNDFRFVMATAGLDDILPVVHVLSKAFQAKDADFTVLVEIVPAVLDCLEGLKIHFGPSYAEMPARLDVDGDLADCKLRYSHPDNPVHQNVHANTYAQVQTLSLSDIHETSGV